MELRYIFVIFYVIHKCFNKRIKAFLTGLYKRWQVPSVIEFFAVIPAAKNFKCVAPMHGGRCGKRPNEQSRNLASRIRLALSELEPSDPATTSLLEAYAKGCLCYRHAKPTRLDAIISTLVKAWRKDLKNTFNALPYHTDGIYKSMPGAFEECMAPFYQSSTTQPQALDNSEPSTTKSCLDQWKDLFQFVPPGIELISFTKFTLGSPGVPEKISKGEPREFSPYVRGKELTLLDVVLSPLSNKEMKEGHIYAFTREGDKSFIKVGYTTQTVTNRLARWNRSCGYTPILIWNSEGKVPHAKRIEAIVHIELESRLLRWREACKTNIECETLHKEWFKATQDEATKTIKYWIEWMQTHLPYDENGLLKLEAVLQMFLPKSSLSEHKKALHFVSDSRGEFWANMRTGTDDAEGDDSIADRVSDSTTVQTPLGPLAPNINASEPGERPFETSVGTPDLNDLPRPKVGTSTSEPTLPSSRTPIGNDEEDDAHSTPSKAPNSGRTRPSRHGKSTSSARSVRSMNSAEKHRRVPTRRKSSRESTTEVAPSRTTPLKGTDASSNRGASPADPICIISDTDEESIPIPKSKRVSTARSPRGPIHVKKVPESPSPAPPLTPSKLPECRYQNSPGMDSVEFSSSSSTPPPQLPGASSTDPIENYNWPCPICNYRNSAYASGCEVCRHVITDFNAVEEMDLQPSSMNTLGRRQRPIPSSRRPSSDPVLALPQDKLEDGENSLRLAVNDTAKRRRMSHQESI